MLAVEAGAGGGTLTIDILIPGEPCAQARGSARLIRRKGGALVLNKTTGQPIISVRDPEKSRTWKATAQDHMASACPAGWKPLLGAVEVAVLAVFTCPTSDFRKRIPRDRRYHVKHRGDIDNLAKAVLDAATGVLWLDDAQVARLEVEKHLGAQGEAPYVLVRVSPLPEEVPLDDEEGDDEDEIEARRGAPAEASASTEGRPGR